MRIVASVFFVVALWPGGVSAESDTSQKNCNTGEQFHVTSKPGEAEIRGECRCVPTDEKPCPKICDVLHFDHAGNTSVACTIRINACTPLDYSVPSCNGSDIRAAGNAVSTGQQVFLNQYDSGSTRENATVVSVPLGTSEMNVITGSFAVDMVELSEMPLDAQSMHTSLDALLSRGDGFTTEPPPSASYSPWHALLQPIDKALYSWGSIQPPSADLNDPMSRSAGYSFWGQYPGTFANTGETASYSYSMGSFLWDVDGPPRIFTGGTDPFDVDPTPSYIPDYFTSDYAPRFDRLDPATVPTTPFNFYSWGALPPGYNPFEVYNRQMWWEPDSEAFQYNPLVAPPPSTTSPGGGFWSGVWDGISSGATEAWDFGRNFNCRIRGWAGQPTEGDSC